MGDDTAPRGMLITVGGQSEQIVFSLEQSRPDYVVFLATRTPASEGEVDTIVQHFELPPSKFRLLTVPDTPDAAAALAEKCREGYYWLTTERGVAPADIGLDATGGRKWMSAAALMAGMALGLHLPYVHVETKRDENGRVTPDPRTMRIVPLDSIYECAQMPLLALGIARFNATDFHGARLIFDMIQSGDLVLRSLVQALRDLAAVADRIDRFEPFRSDLTTEIDRLAATLRQLAGARPYLADLNHTADQWTRLRDVYGGEKPAEPRPEVIAWMLLAARRREQRGQYDGAVLLYYRIIELAAQIWLWQRGIDTSDPDWSKVPSQVEQRWKCRYGRTEKIGLVAGYVLLHMWGAPEVEPLGHKDRKGLWRPDFEKVLEERNYMFSVHGFRPVAQEEAQRFARYARHIAERVTRLTDQQIQAQYDIPPLPILPGCGPTPDGP
ncbi:MAG: TIGR02710 family CRISPR-associated protein [Armatimonadetes bacterium]|nr:TIGR02710 family CRISPR-associated protein [Armatimonadota bacterium]